ncbi:hypothetical protein ACQ86N_26310 [Puia sp. P3]|uniref:hypothetical protein n=1 Tax=Puia sp. P3 TaxID=3423952 RepID=UPI003D678B05
MRSVRVGWFLAVIAGLGPGSCFSQIDSIVQNGRTTGWNLVTRSAVYQIAVTEKGAVVPLYYGPRAHAQRMGVQDRTRGNGPFVLEEVPVRGKYADKVPILEVVFSDHTRVCELRFVSAEILITGNRQTLRIVW